MKILSISSAPGWFAKYEEDNGGIYELPLACWALAQDIYMKGENDVVGMVYDSVTNLVEAADSDNFKGFRHESEAKAH